MAYADFGLSGQITSMITSYRGLGNEIEFVLAKPFKAL